MELSLKTYQDKKYIEYSEPEEGLRFTNAEYFAFDVQSERFREIMSATGGFVANMTTRFIKENNLDVSQIMLCCVPQEYNNFVFQFVYLDDNNNILAAMSDSNYSDYQYFKEKFADCIVKEGFIYELEDIETLKTLTDEFHPSPSLDFDFTVAGRKIHFDDTFVCQDFSIFRENVRKNLERIGAKEAILSFNCRQWNFNCITLKGKIIGQDDKPIPGYQVSFGVKNEEEYIKLMKEKYPEYHESRIDNDDYEFSINLATMKAIADKLEFYEEKENRDASDDFEDR